MLHKNIKFQTVLNCISTALAFRHKCQSGTAGHGLVRHCPAMIQWKYLTICTCITGNLRHVIYSIYITHTLYRFTKNTKQSDLFILASGRWFHVKISLPWERIGWFIEDRAFSQSYDFGSFPILHATNRKTEIEKQLADGIWGEGGGGAKSYHGEKFWFSLNDLILPDLYRWMYKCTNLSTS